VRLRLRALEQLAAVSEEDKSPYDAVADYYACAWDDWYVHSIRPALETLLFPLLAPNARVLDVCCGCGHVTGELVKAGFRTTGFDLSRELCARAARSLPDASFFTADVRTFVTRRVFEGAISTFDSLNHMLTIRDLGEAL
jgi:trans-aconitate methyltransferase